MSRVAVITGCSSGIGFETAKNLATDPEYACVILGVRNVKKMVAAMEKFPSPGAMKKCEIVKLDLADLKSVKAFSDSISRICNGRIDRLILNAGINDYTNPSKRETVDGIDEIWQVNFFSNFFLLHLLRGRIGEDSRVVCLSSVMHWLGNPKAIVELSPEGVVDSGRKWWSTYADTKLALTVLARGLNARGTHAVAVNPGSVASDIFRSWYAWRIIGSLIRVIFSLLLLTCQQGARTSIYACSSELDVSEFRYLTPYKQVNLYGEWGAFLCDIHCPWTVRADKGLVGVCSKKVDSDATVKLVWNKAIDVVSRAKRVRFDPPRTTQ